MSTAMALMTSRTLQTAAREGIDKHLISDSHRVPAKQTSANQKGRADAINADSSGCQGECQR